LTTPEQREMARVRSRAWYAAHAKLPEWREKNLISRRKWRQANREKVRGYSRKWHRAHPGILGLSYESVRTLSRAIAYVTNTRVNLVETEVPPAPTGATASIGYGTTSVSFGFVSHGKRQNVCGGLGYGDIQYAVVGYLSENSNGHLGEGR